MNNPIERLGERGYWEEKKRIYTVLDADPYEADHVLCLLDKIDALRSVIRDFADHGLRCDLDPPVSAEAMLDPVDAAAFYTAYLRDADQELRRRAKGALDA